MGNLRQALQVKELGTAIEDGGQERHCHILRHGGEDVLLAEGLAIAAVDDLHRFLGVETAAFDETGNGVAVGGEVQLVNEDLVACALRFIEGGDALVDIQGGVGADGDLLGAGVNEAGQFCADDIVVEEIVGRCPRPDVDAVGFPVLQSTQYGLFRVLRAKAQGVAVHVDLVFFRVEMVAEMGDGVEGVLIFSKGSAVFVSTHGMILLVVSCLDYTR